eukprot:3402021-Alexandrium_andersonii.AAC.1
MPRHHFRSLIADTGGSYGSLVSGLLGLLLKGRSARMSLPSLRGQWVTGDHPWDCLAGSLKRFGRA